MMRLPPFSYFAPTQLSEAAKILANEGPDAMLLAGGTDLLPNMKRRQQTPKTLVGLSKVESLRQTFDGSGTNESGLVLGAGLTLTELVENRALREMYPGLWQAASVVATPLLRNTGTIGGNICLDTRCNYYNQNEDWRKAINYCLKKDGETCWVATTSDTCRAVSSTDTAPALISLGAKVRLVSASGERVVEMKDLYQNDGADYMQRRPDEILSEVILDAMTGWRSTYWKLRRRGSFDFPILSVAAAIRADEGGTIEDARLVLGAVSSQPLLSSDATEFLIGKKLTDDVIEETGRIMAKLAKPRGNTDLTPIWRKKMVPSFVNHALRELRGDDVRELRKHIAHQARS
jgi:4-hydroxybenzoyl-CoA reductase subunit beta